MAKSVDVAILLLGVALAAILHSTEAEDFTVGDSTGWINSPSGGSSFYSNWAANLTFRVNDTLVFNFATGSHDVAILSTQANFDNCSVGDPLQLITTGPARVTLNRTGEFYFACAFPGHCSSGQKLSVNVVSGSSSPSPPGEAPAEGPSGTSPTEPGAPPPQGSATSVAATFSLILTAIAVTLFLHF